jgi:hypothetical protein
MASPHQRPRFGLPAGGSGQYRADSIETVEELKGGATALAGRERLIVQPTDGDIYIGRDNSVLTTTGIKIASGTIIELSGTWYAIAASAVDVRIHAFID